MRWPFRTTRTSRPALFAQLGNQPDPDYTLGHWGQYKSDVDDVALPDFFAIDRVAWDIVNSFSTYDPVRAVLVQGHADQDLNKHGPAREQFEHKISEKRAYAVMNRLRGRVWNYVDIHTQFGMNDYAGLATTLTWGAEGLGARRRVKTHPANEAERAMNRRTEVYLAHGSRPLHGVSSMQCLHSGWIMRAPGARGLPSPFDDWRVIACPFHDPLTHEPSPCVRVDWIFSTFTNEGLVIDADSQGQTLNVKGLSQGPVIILPG